jgi:flavodoxin long chain
MVPAPATPKWRQKIDIIGPELVTLHNLKDDAVALMEQYDVLILGIPTWDFGEIQEDWEAIWDQLDTVNLDGKIIAMYGMGDQLGYGEWFLDALGMLHDKLALKGVTFIGYWPTEGYEFTSKNRLLPTGSLSGWRWMKPTSTTSAKSKTGASKSWVKWPRSLASRPIPASVVATPSGADPATPLHPYCPLPATSAGDARPPYVA